MLRTVERILGHGCSVVGNAPNGALAIEEVLRLQPDIVIMDVMMPEMNGIEACHCLRQRGFKAKILFMSTADDPDIREAAMKSGGDGFLSKFRLASELKRTVFEMLQGQPRAHSNNFIQVPDPSLVSKKEDLNRRHEAQFYPDDASFLDGFSSFVGAALEAGNAVIVVATEPHRDSLVLRLQAHGMDVGAAIEQGRYISLDAAEILSTIMAGGLPDAARFLRVAGDLIVEAAKSVKGEYARVAACGECAPLLWVQGKADAAIQLEHLWDEIAKSYGISVLCGYPLGSFQGEVGSYIFDRICEEHSVVHSL